MRPEGESIWLVRDLGQARGRVGPEVGSARLQGSGMDVLLKSRVR